MHKLKWVWRNRWVTGVVLVICAWGLGGLWYEISPHVSKGRYEQIEVGMTELDVKTLLGEPEKRIPMGHSKGLYTGKDDDRGKSINVEEVYWYGSGLLVVVEFDKENGLALRKNFWEESRPIDVFASIKKWLGL